MVRTVTEINAYNKGYQQCHEDMTKCESKPCNQCKKYDRLNHKCDLFCKVVHTLLLEVAEDERNTVLKMFQDKGLTDAEKVMKAYIQEQTEKRLKVEEQSDGCKEDY